MMIRTFRPLLFAPWTWVSLACEKDTGQPVYEYVEVSESGTRLVGCNGSSLHIAKLTESCGYEDGLWHHRTMRRDLSERQYPKVDALLRRCETKSDRELGRITSDVLPEFLAVLAANIAYCRALGDAPRGWHDKKFRPTSRSPVRLSAAGHLLDAGYLLDALSGFATRQLYLDATIFVGSTADPIVIRESGGARHAVIMPMRMREEFSVSPRWDVSDLLEQAS